MSPIVWQPMLAALVSPVLFYAGAAAATAPIIIHLLARRRFKRIRWAAVQFLLDAERRNRRRVRMEEWILMALRCLAVLCIALIVSRPFLSPQGVASALGGSARTERIFVLDDSFSMGYESADGTAMDRAKAAARRLLEGIRSDTPDDTVTVVRTSALAEPVATGVYLDERQTDDLLSRIEALARSELSMDPTLTMRAVADLLQRDPSTVSAAVYVISDFQLGQWATSGTESASAPRILAPLKDWAGEDRSLQLTLVDVGDDEAANLAVVDAQVEARRLVAGATGRLSANVSNAASAAASNVEVQVSVGGVAQSSRTMPEVGAGQTAAVELEATFLRPGDETVVIETAPDALPIDNRRHLTVNVSSAVRVLIVNGRPSTDPYDDEVDLLATALRPEGAVFSGIEPTVIEDVQLDATDLSSFHAVVLANVYRVSDAAAAALERFAREGGGVVVFLGDQVDADACNATLHRGGEGMLPAELRDVIAPERPVSFSVTDRLHPWLRLVAREGDPLGLSHVAFTRYVDCVPAPAEEELENGDEANGRQRPASVLAVFDDGQARPAILERSFGDGKVLLVATSCDKDWNNWPDHPTYVPLMVELMQYVARPSESQGGLTVGAPLEIPLDPARFQPDALIRTPAYPAEREFGVTAAPSTDGQSLVLRWDRTAVSGVYQVVLTQRGGQEETRLLAVNLDPEESDLTPATEADLRAALTEVPFAYAQGLEGLSADGALARVEFWRAFLIAAAVVLMTEQFLAWLFGVRARAGAAEAVARSPLRPRPVGGA